MTKCAILTLMLAAVLLLGIGLLATERAQGTNLIIEDGQLLSPGVSGATPDPATFPSPGCLGCFFCPANVTICRAAVFASPLDAQNQANAFGITCNTAGCGGVFASLACDPASLESVHSNDPNFNPILCAEEVVAGRHAAPALSQLALASLTVLMLGVGVLGLRPRATR